MCRNLTKARSIARRTTLNNIFHTSSRGRGGGVARDSGALLEMRSSSTASSAALRDALLEEVVADDEARGFPVDQTGLAGGRDSDAAALNNKVLMQASGESLAMLSLGRARIKLSFQRAIAQLFFIAFGSLTAVCFSLLNCVDIQGQGFL